MAAERSQLIRLFIWAAMSVVLGTTFVAIITLRRLAAPIILAFATQMLAWGTVEFIVAAVRWESATMRDVSAATRLDRLTWFGVGLDVGIAGVGIAVLVVAWRYGRKFGAIGAGLGIIVQGLGLLVLDLMFASIVARLI